MFVCVPLSTPLMYVYVCVCMEGSASSHRVCRMDQNAFLLRFLAGCPELAGFLKTKCSSSCTSSQ